MARRGSAEQLVDRGQIAASSGCPRQIQAACDRLQQVVEVMRDAGGQPADGLHLLRLRHSSVGFLHFEIGRAPRRVVAGDLGISEQRPGLVVDRINDDVRPETASILPDAPTLVLKAPLSRRCREAPGRVDLRRDLLRYRTPRNAGR